MIDCSRKNDGLHSLKTKVNIFKIQYSLSFVKQNQNLVLIMVTDLLYSHVIRNKTKLMQNVLF